MRFRNTGGIHTGEDGVQVKTGEVCESELQLDEVFLNHFEQVSDNTPLPKRATPRPVARTPVIVDDEDESEENADPRGADITAEFKGVADAGLFVFQFEAQSKSGKTVARYNVYDKDAPSVTLTPEPLTAKALPIFLAKYVPAEE
jgi:hypothetical protein